MKRILGILGFVLVAGVVLALTTTARADPPFRRHSLAGLSSSAVGQYALDYTRAKQYSIAGAEPTVQLVRPVTGEVLDALGWQGRVPTDGSRVLVILRGDFDLSGKIPAPPGSYNWHFTYIGYVFDVATGYDEEFTASPYGGTFSKVLGDPSLYDPPMVTPDPKKGPAQPVPAAPRLPSSISSDSPAPTVVPPGR